MKNLNFCPNCGHDLVQYKQKAESDSINDIFKEAVQLAIDNGTIRTSLLQRKFRIGYAKAARIIDTMEDMGYISPADGSKPRQVLIKSIDEM